MIGLHESIMMPILDTVVQRQNMVRMILPPENGEPRLSAAINFVRLRSFACSLLE